ncbi:hypothetical protein RIF29_16094 [Crotalaria pallida]|uniref:Uncharacterized protein n=1 Tax=Crotalaria pallida TaxID=3830 RepID=A0AAN9IE55_CROPI
MPKHPQIGRWVEDKELMPLAIMPSVQEEHVDSSVDLEKEIVIYQMRGKGKEVAFNYASSGDPIDALHHST